MDIACSWEKQINSICLIPPSWECNRKEHCLSSVTWVLRWWCWWMIMSVTSISFHLSVLRPFFALTDNLAMYGSSWMQAEDKRLLSHIQWHQSVSLWYEKLRVNTYMNDTYMPTACSLRFNLDLLKGTLIWKQWMFIQFMTSMSWALLDFKQMKKEYSPEDSYYLQIKGHLI